MEIVKKKFHGSLDTVNGQLYRIEVFFDDTIKDIVNAQEPKKVEGELPPLENLSDNMLKSAFGENFPTMSEESLTDFPKN